MPGRCAACGAKIYLWPFRMTWCPNCRTFSCGRCRNPEQHCPICESKTAPSSYSFEFGEILIFTALFLCYGTLFFIDSQYRLRGLFFYIIGFGLLAGLLAFLQYRRMVSDKFYQNKKHPDFDYARWSFEPVTNVQSYQNVLSEKRNPWFKILLVIELSLATIVVLSLFLFRYFNLLFLMTICGAAGAIGPPLILSFLIALPKTPTIPNQITIGDDGFAAFYPDGSRMGFRWGDIFEMSDPQKSITTDGKDHYTIELSTWIRKQGYFS